MLLQKFKQNILVTFGDFLVDYWKRTVLSLATAVVNGADVATNLMPLICKML